ncbi:MAG: methylenetetrahydrofolate reductase C-terminal domain-containing protein [Desulfurococcales archaeon]|nr:methylenetetrahydrofolate reductase C-terminal domain-containing protein [Desulfurococcales archaeon]
MEKGCPKNMVNGPCGGVDPKGRCEVDGRPCPYIQLLEDKPEVLENPILGPGFIKRDISLDLKGYAGFMEKMLNNNIVFLLELEPSRRGHGLRFLDQAKSFKGLVDGFSITDNPLGRVQADPVAAAGYLRANGFTEDILVHLSCKDRNRANLTSSALGGLWLGVRSYLALTGDWPGIMAGPHVKPVFDLDAVRLIYMLRLLRDHGLDYMGGKIKEVPGFNIAGATNPYSLWEIELRKLKAKRKAGMEFIVSQPLFNDEAIRKLKDIKDEPLLRNLPLIATVMLVRNKWDRSVVKNHFHLNLERITDPLKELENTINMLLSLNYINGILIVFSGDWNYAEGIANIIKQFREL